jgi:uncharacterized protein
MPFRRAISVVPILVCGMFSALAQTGRVFAQAPAAGQPAARVPAKLKQNTAVNPVYTGDAKRNSIQGTVTLETLIDQGGVPKDIRVLRPLGFGLDESSVEALSHWRYQPATSGGRPTVEFTTVRFNFLLTSHDIDATMEEQWNTYNVALKAIQENRATPATIKTLSGLMDQKFAPAMYLYAKLLDAGQGVAADPEGAFRLIQASADQRYGPAIYEVAMARLNGKRLEKDTEKAIELMRDAAMLGSRGAETYLGDAYEKGDGVPVDFKKSQDNFRLCAAAGIASCQHRLGESLIEHPGAPKPDYALAAAWLTLAANQGDVDASKLLEQERVHLAPKQQEQVNELTKELAGKQ